MVDIFGLSASQFETFLLVFVRVSAMLFLFPVFSAPQIPILARFGLSALLSVVLFHLVPIVPASSGLYELGLGVIC
ncbi:MAG: flagellar biosynthetic protein FliR, partial [Candidatus Baltobacteraceae bacterium]